MTYTPSYFIEKFEAIPEEQWITNLYRDEVGRCCALGWCGVRDDNGQYKDTSEAVGLRRLYHKTDFMLIRINEGIEERYQQPTPKQRVLASLRDIKNQTNQ